MRLPDPNSVITRECRSAGELLAAISGFHQNFVCGKGACDHSALDVEIIEDHIPNAWMLGDARLVLSSSLISMVESSEELAFILAHELSHQILGHSSSSRNNEYAADDFARIMLLSNGYNVEAGVRLLERIADTEVTGSLTLGQLFPTIVERIQRL